MKGIKRTTLPPAGSTRLTINMPKALHARLGKRAAKDGKTITALIVWALAAKGVK